MLFEHGFKLENTYILKRQSQLQQTTNFVTPFLIFEKNKV